MPETDASQHANQTQNVYIKCRLQILNLSNTDVHRSSITTVYYTFFQLRRPVHFVFSCCHGCPPPRAEPTPSSPKDSICNSFTSLSFSASKTFLYHYNHSLNSQYQTQTIRERYHSFITTKPSLTIRKRYHCLITTKPTQLKSDITFYSLLKKSLQNKQRHKNLRPLSKVNTTYYSFQIKLRLL